MMHQRIGCRLAPLNCLSASRYVQNPQQKSARISVADTRRIFLYRKFRHVNISLGRRQSHVQEAVRTTACGIPAGTLCAAMPCFAGYHLRETFFPRSNAFRGEYLCITSSSGACHNFHIESTGGKKLCVSQIFTIMPQPCALGVLLRV